MESTQVSLHHHRKTPSLLPGNGSNSLFSIRGFSQHLISLAQQASKKQPTVRAGAQYPNAALGSTDRFSSPYQANPLHVGAPVCHWHVVRDEVAASQHVQRG